MALRESVKRSLPKPVLGLLQSLRRKLAAPPLEEIVLHRYGLVPQSSERPRLTLVIPSIAPEKTFGGIVTGIDIFLELAKRANADFRILLDEFGPVPPANCVGSRAAILGIDPRQIEIVPRLVEIPRVEVRSRDVFVSYNWWTTLNIQGLIKLQTEHFGRMTNPAIYLIQEYEPFFHPFSSTHMMARQAFGSDRPCWGIFNSNELYAYFCAQGHVMERCFVFEPQLNGTLKHVLSKGRREKQKRLLVYGRPAVARNCFSAVEKGLRAWAARYPEFSTWEVLSAGLAHPPIQLANSRTMQSAGKLGMDAYGELLLSSAAGLSLMSSPHPSYPPLEMAHFGLWTVTNSYSNKNLSQSHENIISIDNVAPDTIAEALARACSNFESDPESGWRGKTRRPSFLDNEPFQFLDEISAALKASAWR